MPIWTYTDFERAEAEGNLLLAAQIKDFLLEDFYPVWVPDPPDDEHPDEMAELRKAALSRGSP